MSGEWSDGEFRIIDDEQFFVLARLGDEEAWVEISEDAFKRLADVWDIAGREEEGPTPGLLEDGRAVRVRLTPLGERPLAEHAD